jgi:hypothetical protein
VKDVISGLISSLNGRIGRIGCSLSSVCGDAVPKIESAMVKFLSDMNIEGRNLEVLTKKIRQKLEKVDNRNNK